jgi:hypothetical protein
MTTIAKPENELSAAAATCGRGMLGWDLGEELRDLKDVRVGDVLIQLSRVHSGVACNTIVCLQGAARPNNFGEIAYFQFLIPAYTPGGMSKWHWEVTSASNRLFRALRASAAADNYMTLFRRHAAECSNYYFGDALPVPERAPLDPQIGRIKDLQVRINRNLE